MSRFSRRQQVVCGMVIVLLVAAVGMVLALQGWQSRLVPFDWTGRWIRGGEAKYLTAALITWAAGLYVFMEIAPALFILPAMWLWQRAPLRLWAVVVGVGMDPAPRPRKSGHRGITVQLGGERRFWWLWPLQVILLAAFVTNVLPRLRAPRPFTWIAYTALIVIVLGDSFMLSRVEQWLRTGWSGPDGEQIQALDYVAEQLRAEGRSHAAIGYHIALGSFMAQYHAIEPQYKVGADFDLLLKFRHDISNASQCAEGISDDDEYRIVQITPLEPGQEYLAASIDKKYQLRQQFESYQVFKRN